MVNLGNVLVVIFCASVSLLNKLLPDDVKLCPLFLKIGLVDLHKEAHNLYIFYGLDFIQI